MTSAIDGYTQHMARRNLRKTYVYAQRGTLKRLGLWLTPRELLDAGTEEEAR